MIRRHDVSQLTTAELERAKRELRANLGLITSHSPAHAPIQAQLRAIDSELAERAERQQVTGNTAVPAGTGLHHGQQGQHSLRGCHHH